MKKLLFILSILISTAALGQVIPDSLITLVPKEKMDVHYVLENVTIQFNKSDILDQFKRLKSFTTPKSMDEYREYRMAIEVLEQANQVMTVTFSGSHAEPGLKGLDQWLQQHIASALLKAGKATVIDNRTGKGFKQIKLKQRIDIAPNKVCTFLSMTNEKFFTGQLLARQVVVTFEPPSSGSGGYSEIPTWVEQMPVPPGGKEKYEQYLTSQQRYSNKAREVEVSGKVVVWFIVNTDGSLENFIIYRNLYYDLDREAIRLIKEGGNWTPGSHNGKPVPVNCSQTVRFIYPGK